MTHRSKTVLNRTTWITVSVFGSVIALSGIHHGYFEVLQGNISTEFNIIQSIGLADQYWSNGEEAFTLIPNFLITGIVAILTSIAIIIWSTCCMRATYGPSIFLLLYIFLTLTGGGFIHILFFIPVWLYSMRIRSALTWRGKHPTTPWIRTMTAAWFPMLIFTSFTFILAMEISIFGISGATEQVIYSSIIILMLTSLVFLNLTFFAALTMDIEKNAEMADSYSADMIL